MARKVIRAPFAGQLGIRLINIGEYLNPGTPITVLESSDTGLVDFTLPQQRMSELSIGFSRDGFHWSRPDRRPFIAATRQKGDWERAYVQFTGGVTLIDGDRLLFYYVGFSGEAPNGPDM